MEAHRDLFSGKDPESGRRDLALKLAGDLASRLLSAESKAVWQAIVWWKLKQPNVKAREAAEDAVFQEYLDTNALGNSDWLYNLEQSVPGDVRKVLTEVFAIAKKILLNGNGAQTGFQPGTSQSNS